MSKLISELDVASTPAYLSASDLLVIERGGLNYQTTLSQDISIVGSPTFVSLSLSALTDQIILASASLNTMTVTMSTLTSDRIFTLPDANSNSIIPSTAASNQFATGISSGGVISYLQPAFSNLSGIATPTQGGTGVNNGSSTLTIGGNTAFSGSFTFTGTLTGNTNVTFPTSGTLLTSSSAVTSIIGTANQITASASTGAVTLSLPSSVTISNINLIANTNQIVLGTTNTITVTMASQSASHTFTLPNANSNPIQPLGSATANEWVQYIDATGTQNLVQPAFSNLTGIATPAQGGTGVNNGSSTITVGGNTTFSGAFTFTGTITGNTSVTFPTSGTLLTSSSAVTSITGTANQVIASASTGAVTLSLPQSIDLSSSPTFANINFTANTTQIVLGTTNTMTFTMASQSTSHTFTLPNANSNPIQPLGSATANNWIQYIDATGTQNLAQPAFSNLSGAITSAQQNVASDTALGAVKYDNITITLNGSNQLILTGSYNSQTIATTNQLIGQVVLTYDPVNNISTDTVMLDTALVNLNNKINSVVSGLEVKVANAATTANITISNPGTAIFDGYTATNGDTIFLSFQNTTSQNGLYIFNGSSSALTRSPLMNTWTQVTGALIVVENGTLYGGSLWISTAAAGGTIGTTAIIFSEIATVYSSGLNISIVGTTINTVSSPIFTSETLSANTNFLTTGTTNTMTFTMASQSASHTFTLPNANSNSVQPLGSATANNWVQYIDATGTQNLAQPAFSNLTGIATSAQGGTGVNNGSSTITIGGNTTFSGAFTFTGTITGNTSVTFPTSGTLATTSQVYTFNDVTGTSATMAGNNIYMADNTGLVTLTLPPTCAQGQIIIVTGNGVGGWIIAQTTGQTINIGNMTTTSGSGGSLASTVRYDSITMICSTANTTFNVISMMGNITIV